VAARRVAEDFEAGEEAAVRRVAEPPPEPRAVLALPMHPELLQGAAQMAASRAAFRP
jgi:hypothetical protein